MTLVFTEPCPQRQVPAEFNLRKHKRLLELVLLEAVYHASQRATQARYTRYPVWAWIHTGDVVDQLHSSWTELLSGTQVDTRMGNLSRDGYIIYNVDDGCETFCLSESGLHHLRERQEQLLINGEADIDDIVTLDLRGS